MKKLLAIGTLVIVSSLSSCATSSDSFVQEQTGVAVIRGRITAVQNLSASKIERLGDGLAVTISQPGCTVSMQFAENQSRVMELEPGTIVIYGGDTDYVIRAAPGKPTR